ncbi:katanin p80 WD40 repeat-containing subunit B1 [Histomonas meleagridis]|uniref:katanin p80 WD40 repeat-containing subunit B1 n=1 Tax=Histomonas meleagridis TaxID=135588 RepID=UPI003559EBB3|nr:katanin p80 WD40 repeat-containing subunit B1 [Histomonas meleagridis]KAH0800207.1 katanin p80 WD40 repeat-containing subunit B1 [Histomonas meleagridis]
MRPKLHQLQSVIAHEGEINAMALGHRTGSVFATGGDDRFLHLWSIGSNNPRASFGPFQSPITVCKFDSTEESIICGNNGGTVMHFDLNGSRCISNWAAHRSAVLGLAFHPQNPKLVLSCGYDGKLHILSSGQRRPIQSYNAHNGPANHVSISSDGRYAATCGDDKTVRVFDLSAQKQLFKFDSHTDSVTCVEFHPTDPILISSSVDRSIRFYDLIAQKEIPVSFPLDSAPVDIVSFSPTHNVAFSISADYLKIVGWNPPEFFDHFTVGLEKPHDVSIDEQLITIASSRHDCALIHRMRLSNLKPFSHMSTQSLSPLSEPKKHSRPTTPRLIDQSAISQFRAQSPKTRKQTPNNKESRVQSVRKKQSGPSTNNNNNNNSSNPVLISTEFRKSKSTFMSQINDKYARLMRINEMLQQFGLTSLMQNVLNNVDLGCEVLSILRLKPEVVKLEHSVLMLQIASKIFDADQDLAVQTIEAMLQGFGKLVYATQRTTLRRIGVDVALEERKEKCESFVEAFREVAPKLKAVASGKSNNAQTAAEILDEWKMFLK